MKNLNNALIMYAGDNSDMLPFVRQAPNSHLPYAWERGSFVGPLGSYAGPADAVIKAGVCPGTTATLDIIKSSRRYGTVNSAAEYWEVDILYLGALGDQPYGAWKEDYRTVAKQKLTRSKSTDAMLADQNIWLSGRTDHRINHRGGRLDMDMDFSIFRALMVGGNRAHVDGSARWIPANQSGKWTLARPEGRDPKVATDCHYEHGGGRPYFW